MRVPSQSTRVAIRLLGGGDFPAQADAETWIGEEWQALLKSGVEAVTLMEDDREVYGPMSLHPPAE